MHSVPGLPVSFILTVKKVFVVSFRSGMMLIGVGNPGGGSLVCAGFVCKYFLAFSTHPMLNAYNVFVCFEIKYFNNESKHR